MGGILMPTQNAEDWKRLLADKQWKRGFSARALAYCWQEADGFPKSIRDVFAGSGLKVFENLKLLLALPEHKVPLPGGSRASQNDIWMLGRSDTELVSIAVEGKVSEPFGPTVGEWLENDSEGKQKRLAYLRERLGLTEPVSKVVRYQLLHRAASAVIEANRFNAAHAMMLIHSFSQADKWFEDYQRFLSLFRVKGQPNTITSVGRCEGLLLYFAWVRGEEHYLRI